MSEPILSQEEINALLAAIDQEESGASEVRAGPSSEEIVPYDFFRPDKFSKDQLRTLHMMHETFARNLEISLSAYLRAVVEVEVVSVDEMTYEEFSRVLSNPTILAVTTLAPLEGRAVVEVNPDLGFAVIDRLLGGPGMLPKRVRELSEIEQSVMRRIIERMMENLQDAWRQVVPIESAVERMEVNPQFTQVVPAKDMTVAIALQVSMRGISGRMNLCFPYTTLEPIASKLNAQYWFTAGRKGREGEHAAEIQRRIQSLRLPVTVLLGQSKITVREFTGLRQGDLLRLDGSPNEPLRVMVGKRAKFVARPGRVGSRLAVEVLSVLEDEEEVP